MTSSRTIIRWARLAVLLGIATVAGCIAAVHFIPMAMDSVAFVFVGFLIPMIGGGGATLGGLAWVSESRFLRELGEK